MFVGKDRRTQQGVAVKVIPMQEDMSSLRREVDILKDCKNDFVVQYLGSFNKDSTLWIVMELCEPGSVADAMRMLKTTLTAEQIRIVCASVLVSLTYLHSRKLIHRDVKAGNLLLTRQGQVKIADFGVSAQLNTLQSKRDTSIGAPLWMAPEVIQGESYDNKAERVFLATLHGN